MEAEVVSVITDKLEVMRNENEEVPVEGHNSATKTKTRVEVEMESTMTAVQQMGPGILDLIGLIGWVREMTEIATGKLNAAKWVKFFNKV